MADDSDSNEHIISSECKSSAAHVLTSLAWVQASSFGLLRMALCSVGYTSDTESASHLCSARQQADGCLMDPLGAPEGALYGCAARAARHAPNAQAHSRRIPAAQQPRLKSRTLHSLQQLLLRTQERLNASACRSLGTAGNA